VSGLSATALAALASVRRWSGSASVGDIRCAMPSQLDERLALRFPGLSHLLASRVVALPVGSL
jgi:hypothetical protein